jgi:hypothetical protein
MGQIIMNTNKLNLEYGEEEDVKWEDELGIQMSQKKLTHSKIQPAE